MSTERQRSCHHVTTVFPTEYVRAGEPRSLTCRGVERGGDVVTANRCPAPIDEQARLDDLATRHPEAA